MAFPEPFSRNNCPIVAKRKLLCTPLQPPPLSHKKGLQKSELRKRLQAQNSPAGKQINQTLQAPSTRPKHEGTKSSKSPKRNKRSSPHVGCIRISALLKKQPHNCFAALTRRSHDGAFHCRSRQMPAENDNYKALECPGDTLPVLNIGPKKT